MDEKLFSELPEMDWSDFNPKKLKKFTKKMSELEDEEFFDLFCKDKENGIQTLSFFQDDE